MLFHIVTTKNHSFAITFSRSQMVSNYYRSNPRALQHRRYGLQYYLHVLLEGPSIYVLKVEVHPIVEAYIEFEYLVITVQSDCYWRVAYEGTPVALDYQIEFVSTVQHYTVIARRTSGPGIGI